MFDGDAFSMSTATHSIEMFLFGALIALGSGKRTRISTMAHGSYFTQLDELSPMMS